MSSSGLKIQNFQIMIKDNKQQKLSYSTEPAIAYSTCYRLPFLSLFHADCMEIMKQYPDKYFDLAIVDPPYGMPKDSTHGRGKLKNRILNNGSVEKWDIAPKSEYFEELFRVSKNQIIWGGNYFGLKGSRGFVIWDKEQPFENFSAAEYAWISFQTVSKIFRLPATRTGDETKIHPTQKPIALYEFLIRQYIQNNDKILDTHFGSGSIALAVDKANRLDKMNLHLTACEIDKEYIDKAIKRISESIKQGTIIF